MDTERVQEIVAMITRTKTGKKEEQRVGYSTGDLFRTDIKMIKMTVGLLTGYCKLNKQYT